MFPSLLVLFDFCLYVTNMFCLQDEAMTEVKEEAKESRRERRLQRDKVQTTRFDTDVSTVFLLSM